MKLIIEFDLDNPDDKLSADQCIAAKNIVSVLWDIDQWLRSQEKYSADESITFTDMRTKIREIVEENNVNPSILS